MTKMFQWLVACISCRSVGLHCLVAWLFTYFPHSGWRWYKACYWYTSVKGSFITTVTLDVNQQLTP